MQNGTIADKIAAMTLVVQEAPFFGLTTINSLLTIARKKNRRVNLMAINALKDLFLNTLLPQRKLRFPTFSFCFGFVRFVHQLQDLERAAIN
jgi:ribosome biogenesis protein MAK21